MQVVVKLFALMREKVGTDTVRLEVPEGARLVDVAEALRRQYPVLDPYLARVRYAIQMDFVDAEAMVTAGDEVALIPPVSGGTGCFASPQNL
jgi:molybdopterin converting factor subunit 1